MKFRKFGSLNWKVSALGFGLMRLPVLDNDSVKINEYEAVKMIRYAIDHGVNYFDTAYPYHKGNSEVLLGKVLRDGYREKTRVATKMPTWLINSEEDMDKALDVQLNRLQLGYVDFYLLHALEKRRFDKLLKLHVFDWAEKVKREGKVKHLGFSFHDNFPVFKHIVDSYDDWTLAQIQYNYIDSNYQAGMKGLRYAASKGLAIVVMEPLAGGLLAIKPPVEIQTIWDEAEKKRGHVEWALQWVWNQPEVSVVLSGMSRMNHVEMNIDYAERSSSGLLNERELKLFTRVKQKYRDYGLIGCTGCSYCQPCPQGVTIPEIFRIYNEYFMNGRENEVVRKYVDIIPKENRAGKCVRCGKCEEQCPQKLPIRSLLSRATYLLEHYCQYCGTHLVPEFNFCPICGREQLA